MQTAKLIAGLSLVASLALTQGACGGAAVPQDSLTAAEADIKGAEVAGAPGNPKAALHLKLAKEQVEEAKRLIADDENETAARVIARAQADADLALALAKEARSQAEAQLTKEQVEELKKKISK
jgi:hypothetical protein